MPSTLPTTLTSRRHRRTVSALAAGALAVGTLTAGAVATAGPATAVDRRAAITAHPSDSTVQSGEQFVVRGRFTIDGHAAGGRTVKIQAEVGGDGRPISGARVQTQSDGTYRVRLILSTRGDRDLRAVGVAPQGIRNAYRAFDVWVF